MLTVKAKILPPFNQIRPLLHNRSSQFTAQISSKYAYDVIGMQHNRDSFEIPIETPELSLQLV
ncbi:hypothetical protein ASC94_22780 [Massilia sp. Root418]|nr:hypothetical protein ASC94_22780 [Massilia sp. Root418]